MTTLEDLLVDQIRDLYDAEKQLLRALPKMAEAANASELQLAIQRHLDETENQVSRLERVFEELDKPAKGKACKAMRGLVDEAGEAMDYQSPLSDLAIIAAAQRVEHYEISAYGTARSLARQLGELKCAELLSHTLGEEERADFLLTAIADPIAQQAALQDRGGPDADLEGARLPRRKREPAMSRT